MSVKELLAVRAGEEAGNDAHIAEQFDAVLDAVYASGFEELLHGDGLGRINQPPVDPVLQAVEVEWGHLLVEAARRSSLERSALALEGAAGEGKRGFTYGFLKPRLG